MKQPRRTYCNKTRNDIVNITFSKGSIPLRAHLTRPRERKRERERIRVFQKVIIDSNWGVKDQPWKGVLQKILGPIKTWISNNIRRDLWDVITHPCLNFNGGFAEPPLKLGHGWEVTSHTLYGCYNLFVSSPWCWFNLCLLARRHRYWIYHCKVHAKPSSNTTLTLRCLVINLAVNVTICICKGCAVHFHEASYTASHLTSLVNWSRDWLSFNKANQVCIHLHL